MPIHVERVSPLYRSPNRVDLGSTPAVLKRPPDLVSFRFGIDIVRDGPRRRGFSYEDYCFRLLAEDRDWSFLIGPGIVNAVLERHPVFAGLVKPDFLKIQESEGNWWLEEVVECRSGESMDTQRKLGKLPAFLTHLRIYPLLFPEAVQAFTADTLPAMQPQLMIPADRDIRVTYVTPEPRAIVPPPDSPFVLQHVVIPFTDGAGRRA